jgi:hypothetical protein
MVREQPPRKARTGHHPRPKKLGIICTDREDGPFRRLLEEWCAVRHIAATWLLPGDVVSEETNRLILLGPPGETALVSPAIEMWIWDTLDQLRSRPRTAVLGVCFGMDTIVRYLGGLVMNPSHLPPLLQPIELPHASLAVQHRDLPWVGLRLSKDNTRDRTWLLLDHWMKSASNNTSLQ